MGIIDVSNLKKSFWIPNVHRTTLREHALALFRRRQFDELRVLDRVSFEVRRGETLAIMGRNGSGKSTLLKILTGVYQPDGGAAAVHAPATAILELGLGWNPELDAVDNIFLVGAVMGLSLAEIRSAVDQILAFAELERYAHLKLQHYSSGMAARLAYAVAFHATREVVILDEIFAVGDERFKARCYERYEQLKAAGHTVVLVTHAVPIVSRFCQRALLLERGRIVLDGDPAAVSAEYVRLLMEEGPPPPDLGT